MKKSNHILTLNLLEKYQKAEKESEEFKFENMSTLRRMKHLWLEKEN